MALIIIGAISLAILAGKKMSSDAVGVVIGVVCGVAAGIPSSLILLTAAGRQERPQSGQPGPSVRRGNYPPVVVLQAGIPQSLPGASGYWSSPAPQPSADRQFHLVGGSGQLVEDSIF
jgi:hypothetical protein